MNIDLRTALATVDLATFVQRDGIALQRTGRVWQGCCPFHDETTPSFTVYPDGGGWYCFGCDRGGSALDYVIDRAGQDRTDRHAIVGGLAQLGIGDGPRATLPPLAPRPSATLHKPATRLPSREPDAIYPYYDSTGTLIYQVVRWNLTPSEQSRQDGAHKLIRQRRPDGRGGWLWNLQGVAPLLYNLPARRRSRPPRLYCRRRKVCRCTHCRRATGDLQQRGGRQMAGEFWADPGWAVSGGAT